MLTLLFIIFITSPSFAEEFSENPLPLSVMADNPLHNEDEYDYEYYKTNSLTMPTLPLTAESCKVNAVLGCRNNQSPTWYKENGWTIGTNGLFESRPKGHQRGLTGTLVLRVRSCCY